MENREYFNLDDLYCSRYIKLGSKYYCAYCGKEISLTYEMEDRDWRNYLKCTCCDAIEEMHIKTEIRKLYDRLPKSKFEIGNYIKEKE